MALVAATCAAFAVIGFGSVFVAKTSNWSGQFDRMAHRIEAAPVSSEASSQSTGDVKSAAATLGYAASVADASAAPMPSLPPKPVPAPPSCDCPDSPWRHISRFGGQVPRFRRSDLGIDPRQSANKRSRQSLRRRDDLFASTPSDEPGWRSSVSKYYDAINRNLATTREPLPPVRPSAKLVSKTRELIEQPVREVAPRTDEIALENTFLPEPLPYDLPAMLARQDAIRQLSERMAPTAAVDKSCRVAISGCRPSDGASSIAAALALDLSQRLSMRTILVDANLQSPTLHRVVSPAERTRRADHAGRFAATSHDRLAEIDAGDLLSERQRRRARSCDRGTRSGAQHISRRSDRSRRGAARFAHVAADAARRPDLAGGSLRTDRAQGACNYSSRAACGRQDCRRRDFKRAAGAVAKFLRGVPAQ